MKNQNSTLDYSVVNDEGQVTEKTVNGFQHNGKEKTDLYIEENTSLNEVVQAPHSKIFQRLLNQIQPLDFTTCLGLHQDEKPTKTQLRIKVVEHVLALAINNNWGICKRNGGIYLYNGAYWGLVDIADLQTFLGEAAERLGVKWDCSQDYKFRKELYEQFSATGNLPIPEQDPSVKLNFLNGALFISPEGLHKFRSPKQEDFFTYQLPFEYEPKAKAPQFHAYLNQVLPESKLQNILAEYFGNVFIETSYLKLEKCALIYGTGANGKSVMFDIISSLLGEQNISSYSLQNLTNDNGYFRAKIGNKLLNYASEINGKLEADIFKRLASGEPVDARLPYGDPFILTNYAKLIFNCNELPREVEHTNAFFRRFLIVPFDVVIPEAEQDKQLSRKIISAELPGVFNWLMEGLSRLLIQKRFTDCDVVERQLEQYKRESDSVLMFIDEQGYHKSEQHKALSDLYKEYKAYCSDCGNTPCALSKFSKRLKVNGFEVRRLNFGNVVFASVGV